MYEKVIKRMLDLIIATIGLVLLSPLLLIMTVVGAIVMKGNPFFVQPRPGKRKKNKDGSWGEEKIIKLIKFRSMTCEKDAQGNLLPDEQRMTGYGKFIRKTSLDELGSIICLFNGLSLVGPRPLLVRYLDRYSEEQHHRHDVRPGITGWAQVNGRNAISWEEKFKYDLEYVNNVSFLMDVKILIMTVGKVFKREGISSAESITMEEFMGNKNE